MSILIAIDPGLKGGIAKFQVAPDLLTLVEVIDTPTLGDLGREYNFYEIRDYLRLNSPDVVIIEQQQVRNGEGVNTALSVGVGKGMWFAFFAAFELRHETVQASAWTKRLKLPSSNGLTPKENKTNHVTLACKLYPAFAKQFYGTRSGLKDGRADAVLIGEDWFRQKYQSARPEDEIPNQKIKLKDAVF